MKNNSGVVRSLQQMCDDQSMPCMVFIVRSRNAKSAIESFGKAFLSDFFDTCFKIIDVAGGNADMVINDAFMIPMTAMPIGLQFRAVPLRILAVLHGDALDDGEQGRIAAAFPGVIHECRLVIAFEHRSRVAASIRKHFAIMNIANASSVVQRMPGI